MATALENLAFVAALQSQIARGSRLYHVQAVVDPTTGRLRTFSGGWAYYFVAYDAQGSPETKHFWTVRGDGRVEHEVGPRADDPVIDLMPVATVDSDTAVRLGREQGAQAYVDRYPAATATATLRISITEPVWKVEFYLHSIDGGPGCAVSAYVHANTGAVIDSDLAVSTRSYEVSWPADVLDPQPACLLPRLFSGRSPRRLPERKRNVWRM
jgi:hypothetical protein